jgi:hypothetical protein
LIIGRHQTESPLSLAGYEQLSDANEDTRGIAMVNGKDPLADVFGTDADAWADIRADNGRKRPLNPNVVDLALTAADLSALPSDSLQSRSLVQSEEGEVREMLDRMSRPDSSATATGPSTSPSKHSSSSTQTPRKHVPPPLVLLPNDQGRDLVVPSEPSPMLSSPGSVGLAYLKGDSSPEKSPGLEYVEDEYDDLYPPLRSSTESEKRAGTIYDDLDLGLNPADDVSNFSFSLFRLNLRAQSMLKQFDENDPNDRRKSQFLLKAQLDEIERVRKFTPTFTDDMF